MAADRAGSSWTANVYAWSSVGQVVQTRCKELGEHVGWLLTMEEGVEMRSDWRS